MRSIEHANFVTEDTVAMMADYHAFYVPTFISLVQRVESAAETHLPPTIVENLKRTIDRGRQVYGWARKHKVPIGFGTDLWGPEAQKAQLREFEMREDLDTPAEILRSATVTNAELLMEKGTLGIIAEGAYADLLIVEGNPLADLGRPDEPGQEPQVHHEGRHDLQERAGGRGLTRLRPAFGEGERAGQKGLPSRSRSHGWPLASWPLKVIRAPSAGMSSVQTP